MKSRKTLLLMRHAKSDHAQPGLTDHDRPLNPRGRRTAPFMAELLQRESLEPDWILCSTAQRALETARLVAETLGYTATLDQRRDLYLTSPDDYVQVLRSLPDETTRTLLVGHNPTLEILIAHWRETDEPIPTAAVAWFELPIARWSELRLNTPVAFRQLWCPKDL